MLKQELDIVIYCLRCFELADRVHLIGSMWHCADSRACSRGRPLVQMEHFEFVIKLLTTQCESGGCISRISDQRKSAVVSWVKTTDLRTYRSAVLSSFSMKVIQASISA